MSVPSFYPGQSNDEAVNGMTLLNIGGPERAKAQIRVSRPVPPYHIEVLKGDKWVKLAEVGIREPFRIRVSLSESDYTVQVNDLKKVTLPGKLKRKINFGGFYTDPIAYPSAGTFELDLKTVDVR